MVSPSTCVNRPPKFVSHHFNYFLFVSHRCAFIVVRFSSYWLVLVGSTNTRCTSYLHCINSCWLVVPSLRIVLQRIESQQPNNTCQSESTMMMSSNGSIFHITVPLCGCLFLPVTGEFPAQRPVKQSFDVFFDFRLNKRLSKQSGGWWFETPCRSLWRHSNDNELIKKPTMRYEPMRIDTNWYNVQWYITQDRCECFEHFKTFVLAYELMPNWQRNGTE